MESQSYQFGYPKKALMMMIHSRYMVIGWWLGIKIVKRILLRVGSLLVLLVKVGQVITPLKIRGQGQQILQVCSLYQLVVLTLKGRPHMEILHHHLTRLAPFNLKKMCLTLKMVPSPLSHLFLFPTHIIRCH